jgi:hypothetical protein
MNVDRFLHEGTLVWTMTTNGYKYLTLNLLRSIEKTSATWKLLVVACDRQSFQFFRNEGFAVVLYPDARITEEIGISRWGSPTFARYNDMKLKLLHQFANTPTIQRCVYMDGDIVVFDDFLPELVKRLEAEPHVILFQCDEREIGDCQRKELNGCHNCCTGLIAWKQGAVKNLFDNSDRTTWNLINDDQIWVNRHLRDLYYKTLPRTLYPNGAYIGQNLQDAYLLHFNHRVANSKIVEMKRMGKWLIPY